MQFTNVQNQKILPFYQSKNIQIENFRKHIIEVEKLVKLKPKDHKKLLFNTFNFTNKLLNSSKKEIIYLKSIKRKELNLNFVHKNKILICRLIEKPCKLTSIQCLVEDNNNKVFLTCFYNFKINKYEDIFKLFKKGQRIAIIEPFLKIGIDGNCFVRVDSPSSVVFDYENPNLSLKAEDLKNKGNSFYLKKNYQMAILYYSEAIKTNNKNSLFFSNRALSRIKEKFYLKAVKDCENAILLNKKNPKFYYRKAVAFEKLNLFKEAIDCLSKIENSEIKKKLEEKIKKKIKEMNKGEYDLENLLKNPFLEYKDCSDFIGKIKIIKINNKGRGIVAKEDIEQGELISATKALGFGIYVENKDKIEWDTGVGCMRKEDQKICYGQILEKLENNPLERLRFSFLYGGNDTKNVDINIFRDNFKFKDNQKFPVLDSNFIQNVLSKNAFSANFNFLLKNKNNPNKGKKNIASGLWMMPSFFNHSCYFNATRVFVGNIMFIRSIIKIKKGEEITLTYVPQLDLKERKEILKRGWGFNCNCLKCNYESKFSGIFLKQLDLVENMLNKKQENKKKRYENLKNLLEIIKNILLKTKNNFKIDYYKVIPKKLYILSCNLSLELASEFHNMKDSLEILSEMEQLIHQYSCDHEMLLENMYFIYSDLFGENNDLTKLIYKKLTKLNKINFGTSILCKNKYK